MKHASFKFIITFAAFAYAFMVANTFAHEWEDFKMGFLYGSGAADKNDSKLAGEVYFLTLAPKSDVLSFPEKIQNLKTEATLNARFHKLKVLQPADQPLSLKSKIYRVINTIIAFIVFGIYIYIPFQFYQFIQAVNKGTIFDEKTVQKIRRIGNSLILIFCCISVSSVLFYEIKQELFQFEEYKIIRGKVDGIWLLIGLVMMIIAEMLSRGVEMKKEQELTV